LTAVQIKQVHTILKSNQNQKHIYIAPYVASESEAHMKQYIQM